MTDETGSRQFAVRMVATILEHSTKDDISADDLQQMVVIFNDLDAAHRAMAEAWEKDSEDFMAAIARLREADGRFWTALEKLMPIPRERLEAMIEGERLTT